MLFDKTFFCPYYLYKLFKQPQFGSVFLCPQTFYLFFLLIGQLNSFLPPWWQISWLPALQAGAFISILIQLSTIHAPPALWYKCFSTVTCEVFYLSLSSLLITYTLYVIWTSSPLWYTVVIPGLNLSLKHGQLW